MHCIFKEIDAGITSSRAAVPRVTLPSRTGVGGRGRLLVGRYSRVAISPLRHFTSHEVRWGTEKDGDVHRLDDLRSITIHFKHVSEIVYEKDVCT